MFLWEREASDANESWYNHFGNLFGNTNICEFIHNLWCNSFTPIYPTELYAYMHQNTHMSVHINTIHSRQKYFNSPNAYEK